MDYFDVTETFPKFIKFNSEYNNHIHHCIISFTSDWLFPTIENKEMSMCSQCVEHVEGNDQKLSDLEVVSKKCHGHKANKQNAPTNRRNQKLNKKSKSREKFRY